MHDETVSARDEKVAAARTVQAMIHAGARAAVERHRERSTLTRPDRQGAVASRYNVFIPLRNSDALVYNSFTSSFAKWSPEDIATYERLERESLTISSPELQPFLRGGFIVSEETDERAELEKQYTAMRSDAGSMVLTIAPTLACNFGCDYCYQGTDKPTGNMPPEVQDALIAHIQRKLPELRSLHTAWYGGEPLAARSTILELSDRIVPMCDNAGVAYSSFMVTNGYSLTRTVAKELCDRRVTHYQVTLDGPEEFHDRRRSLLSGGPTYARIIENLREVVENVPVRVTIRINIDYRNRERIGELIDDLAAKGLGGRKNFGVYFAPVEAMTDGCSHCSNVTLDKTPYGRFEADLYRLAFEKKLTHLPVPPRFSGKCAAVSPNGLVLVPSGDLHKCWDTATFPALKVGTIFDVDSCKSSPLHERWMRWTPFANEVCRDCKILPNCTGMCAYKWIHSDKPQGEQGSSPCPSWKFNINERLFLRAEKKGVVSRDDWDNERSATGPGNVGQRHTLASVASGSESPD